MTRPRLSVVPGPLRPTALRGDDGRMQNGRTGTPGAAHDLARHLYAVQGPTTTCGHDNPTIAVRTETGEVLSCRRCVLAAVDDRPGITYLEPMGPGGDDAA